MRFTNHTFTNEDINLDGNQFENCTFERCKLIYEGGKTALSGCTFRDSPFGFFGSAAMTVHFMSQLYAAGGSAIIEAIFDSIRNNTVSKNDVISNGVIH